MPNPFFYGGRVDPSQFIGRVKELSDIFNCLEITHTGQLQSVSIVGSHRLGRSSLLFYISAMYTQYLKYPQQYRVAYISLHDAECHTPSGLLRKILNKFGLLIPANQEVTLADFQDAIIGLKSRQFVCVVCLDEFEELIQTGEFNNDFFDCWRYLMNENSIAFVIASICPLSDLVVPDKYTSSFFNIFTVVHLGEFIDTDVLALIKRGQNCDKTFSEDDVNFMRKLGGKHPYKLQVAGEKIYFSKTQNIKTNWSQVENEVSAQIKQAGLETPENNRFLEIWNTFLKFVRSIGRAILEVRRDKNEISESTALWWGVIAILILMFLVFGWIPISWLFKLGSHWLGK